MFQIVLTKRAHRDLGNLKAANLSHKAKQIVDIIKENPFQNPPRYEKLVGNLEGIYSRRINLQHRLVYQVIMNPVTVDGIEYQGTVKIIRMWTHYDAI